MKADTLLSIMGRVGYSHAMHPDAHLPRYAAMCGFFAIPPMHAYDYRIYDADKIEVPDEIVPKILALHFAEKANNDLRAMGEGMGKLSVNIPSNINVWSHAKGEAQLANAARALTDAVSKIAS